MLNEYLKQQILTATPDQIFLLLIQKCLVLIKSDIIDIAKILEILDALLISLNRDIQNDFIDEIDALLGFLIFEVTKYNIKRDKSILTGITVILTNVEDAWKLRIKNLTKN